MTAHCPPNSSCKNRNGSYECKCNSGFTLKNLETGKLLAAKTKTKFEQTGTYSGYFVQSILSNEKVCGNKW